MSPERDDVFDDHTDSGQEDDIISVSSFDAINAFLDISIRIQEYIGMLSTDASSEALEQQLTSLRAAQKQYVDMIAKLTTSALAAMVENPSPTKN